jgi:glutathione peroxidase
MKYGGAGLEILAFPCNNFGAQEPGTNEEVLAFARSQGLRVFAVLFDVIIVIR